MMTVQEAIANLDGVISGVRMNRQEHIALTESIGLVAKRCKQADELEKKAPPKKKKE